MDAFTEYCEISLQEALTPNDEHDYFHCSHCFLYCTQCENGEVCRFALMQMRSHGLLGFPGGGCKGNISTVDQLVANLNRELEEEIYFDVTKNAVNASDYVFTHRWWHAKDNKYFVLHFFAKQLPVEAFKWIESNHMKAKCFPCESVGLIRVPIVSATSNGTQFKCFDLFMENFGKQHFAGNAKQQLFETVQKLDLLSTNLSNNKRERDS